MNRDIIKECVSYEIEDRDKRDEVLQLFVLFKKHVPTNDIEYYDKVSPILLKELDRREDKEAIFDKFYDSTLKVSIKAIASGKYNMAYYFVKTHILDLQETLLTKEQNDILIKRLKHQNI